jgi:hypothetical protein
LSPIIFLHLQKSTSFAEDSLVLQRIVDLVKLSVNLRFFIVNVYAYMLCDFETEFCHALLMFHKRLVG